MMYDHHAAPMLVHGLEQFDDAGNLPAFFPIPPIPNWIGPDHMALTRGQYGILAFLDLWHWRWSPSMHDIARGVGRSIKGTYKTLLGLRTLGLIDWIKGQDRTLHLTVIGMSILKLHVGPTRLPGAEGLRTYRVSTTEQQGDAYGYQRFMARRRRRIYRQHQRRRRVPPSMMVPRQRVMSEGAQHPRVHPCDEPHPLRIEKTPEELL